MSVLFSATKVGGGVYGDVDNQTVVWKVVPLMTAVTV